MAKTIQGFMVGNLPCRGQPSKAKLVNSPLTLAVRQGRPNVSRPEGFALHVHRPTPIQQAAAHFRLERAASPARPGWHHVEMTGKGDVRPFATPHC